MTNKHGAWNNICNRIWCCTSVTQKRAATDWSSAWYNLLIFRPYRQFDTICRQEVLELYMPIQLLTHEYCELKFQ